MIKSIFTKTILAVGFSAVIGTSAMAADQSELLGKSWDDIVAQAKQEGEVSWFVWYFQPRYREVAAAFTEKYGIKVVIPEGTHEGNIDKFLAESKRGQGDIDVLAMGADRIDLFDPTKLALGPLNDVMPNGNTVRGEVGGNDGQGYAFAYWGNQTGIAYDPEKIADADLPQSIADFEAYFAANPGQIGFNYEKGGSGPSFVQNISRNLTGAGPEGWLDGEVTEERMGSLQVVWDWFLKHTDGYVITASNTDSITRLSGREFTLVAAWEDHLYGLQVKGEIDKRIKFYIPEFGMNGGGNFNMVPLNAPNPAAAIVFLDWISSAETQTKFNQIFGAAPMHPESDDSKSLVPNEMRQYSRIWPGNPFNTEIRQAFVENVVLER